MIWIPGLGLVVVSLSVFRCRRPRHAR